MRKKRRKGRRSFSSQSPPKYWTDWVFLKKFKMFGNGKGWRDQGYTLIQFVVLCMNIEAGLQSEQDAKISRETNKGKLRKK